MLSKDQVAQLMEEHLRNRDYALGRMMKYPCLESTFLEVYLQLVISVTEKMPEVDRSDPTAIVVEQIMQRVSPFLVPGQFMLGFEIGYHLCVFRPRDLILGEIGSDASRIRVCRVYAHHHLVPKISPAKLSDLQLFGCELAHKLGAISSERGFDPGKQPWDT